MIGIDIGNTAIKWMRFGEDVVHRCEDVEQLLNDLSSLVRVSRVVVCSVRGEAFDQTLGVLLYRKLQQRPEFFYTEKAYHGVQCAYGEGYANLGADRWMVILAAAARSNGVAAVVDLGTALTIDIVDPSEGHVGGYIVPGYETLIGAINSRASLINIKPLGQIPDIALGKSTTECVSLGSAYMVAAFVNGVLDHWNVDDVLYTGGGYDLIKKQLRNKGLHIENLVFEGLFLRSNEKNQKK